MLLKSCIGYLSRTIGGLCYPGSELIVVNYHSTPKKFIKNFESQVLFFKKHFDILDPPDLENYFSGTMDAGRCKLLFTFDDGLKNNLYAEEILRRHNIRAFYFLVPDFIETKIEEQKAYYIKFIRPLINKHIDSEPEDFEAMSWVEVNKLLSSGNRVGSHTLSHNLYFESSNEYASKKEILESKFHIEYCTGKKIDSFCSINNTLQSTGKIEKEIIQSNYRFHFTTLPGRNNLLRNPLFIKRRNIECYWPDGAVYFAIGKLDLWRWFQKIKQYTEL